MKNALSCVLVLCLAIVGGRSLAQEALVLPEPVAEHAWLTKFVGEWKSKSKATMSPDQPPVACTATLKCRALGGFWVLNEMNGEMGGDPMTGVQTIGYDAEKQKYIGTWVDTMSSMMWQYEGSVDSSGKILTLQADGPNFIADGKMTKFEDIYEFTSETEMKMTSRMLDTDGKWVTFMSGTATRVK